MKNFSMKIASSNRKYFDSVHVDKALVNVAWNLSAPSHIVQDRYLTDFERDNFHVENVIPDRPCSAFF